MDNDEDYWAPNYPTGSHKDRRKKQRNKKRVQAYCDPCRIGQTDIEANGFCTNCAEYLCEACKTTHTNHKAFRDHVLKDKDGMPATYDIITVEDYCMKHDGKSIEYYCKTCDELACTVCMFKHHRGCENVDYIPDITENFEESEEVKELTEYLNNLAMKNETGQKSLEKSLKSSEESKEKALSKITADTAELKNVFDHLERKMKTSVIERFTKEQQILHDLQKKQDTLTEKMATAKKKVEYYKQAKQMTKLFISLKKERHVIKEVEEELQILQQENNIQAYTFKLSQAVEDVKVLLELGSLMDDNQKYERGSDSDKI